VILATSNLHKVGEMRELLPGIDLEPLPEGYETPVEDGDTFEANALIKARAAHAALGGVVIADDSGIEAFDLDGAPGIYSARYAGEGASDEDNLLKMLAEMHGVPESKRTARYQCVIAFVSTAEDPNPILANGTWEGTLISHARGLGGFGYDPIFIPSGFDRTAAELDPAEKNSLSHRGQALRALISQLQNRGR
jgi:XTP/dITP diphosphohydrolase